MRVNSDTVISYDVHYASLYRTLNVVPPKNCRYWTKVPFINSTTGATISLAFATCVLSRVLKDLPVPFRRPAMSQSPVVVARDPLPSWNDTAQKKTIGLRYTNLNAKLFFSPSPVLPAGDNRSLFFLRQHRDRWSIFRFTYQVPGPAGMRIGRL
jgi:hypothetical protein